MKCHLCDYDALDEDELVEHVSVTHCNFPQPKPRSVKSKQKAPRVESKYDATELTKRFLLLDTSQQHENDQDNDDQTESTGGPVAPSGGVRP